MKKGALFCLKGFIREPKPTKKGRRVLLGILVSSRLYKGLLAERNLTKTERSRLASVCARMVSLILCNTDEESALNSRFRV